MNALAIITLVLKVSIFITALGFGLNATPHDAVYLFRKPGQLLRSILAMNIIMPIFAIFIVLNFDLPRLVNVALIAISVSPLPPIFPKNTLKAGGSGPYTIGLMVAASLFSVVFIPLTLGLLEKFFDKPAEVSINAIVIAVLTTVIAPLFLGILIRHFASAFAEKFVTLVSRIGQILLIGALLPILFKMFPAIISLVGNGTVLAIIAFILVGIITGHLLGGPARENRPVLALATSSRHPAIALSLANANLAEHKLVPAAILLYLLLNAIIVFLYLKWFSKKQPEIPA